jgi:hypothetical protein
MEVKVYVRVGGWVAFVLKEGLEVWRSKPHDRPQDARAEGEAWIAVASAAR